MAFTTIIPDGYGVIAFADEEVNDTGGTGTGDWKELGGGTVGLNTDVYLYSGASPDPASMGSKYASKDGYSYTDGGKSLGYNSGGAEEGEFIYMWIFIAAAGAFDTLANYGFAAFAGNTVATGRAGNNYQWRIASGSDANGWTGGWKLFVLDPATVSDSVGTPSLTGIDTFGVWIDTATSVRADSIFQSVIGSQKGLICTGTPTTAGLGFTELADWCSDYANRANPAFQKRGSILFANGTITAGNSSTATTISSTGETIEFELIEYYNGSAWVSTMPTTAHNVVTTSNAALDLINTNISANSVDKWGLDTSVGNASSFAGGTLKLLRSLAVKATDIFNGTVFADSDAFSLSTASYDGCTFSNCGEQTISSVASFSGNTIASNVLGADEGAVLTDDISIVSGGAFTRDTTGHAIRLNSAGSWNINSLFSGYAVGTVADGLTGTAADAAIYVDVASGTVDINVTGGTTPSIRRAGGSSATINVTGGGVTIDVNVKDSLGANILGALVYVDEDLGVGGNITNTTTDASGNISQASYNGVATTATLRIRLYGYRPFLGTVTLLQNSATNVILNIDPQQT